MIRRTYDGWGYSPLSQITAANVSRLERVWTVETGQINGHEAPPIVNDGVMFVSTPGKQVIALEAATGKVLWRYQRPLPDGVVLLHPTSRGVALFGDKVFLAGNEAVLVALDARTGNEVWTAKVADNSQGYYMTMAPLVADGKVMVGVSGGEYGVRGFVAAFDVATGKQVWQTYSIPAPGEPGSETWPKGDQWKTGGAPFWITGNYDPETNLSFWGTGNGGPWMGDQRPGDNLYTSSTIAVDVATGAIKGHFQYHPNDSWDWDEVSPPILIDYRRNGRTVKGLINVARNGYMWFLERTGDRINFVHGQPFVKQNVFRGLDPKTGRPDVDPARQPGTGKLAEFCPSHWGGKNWPPAAFNPITRMLYVPANENLCSSLAGKPVTYTPGRTFTGAANTLLLAEGATHIGEVQAWHVDTGARAWTHTFATSANWGPILTTAGGLVFSGGTNDRKFRAFDAASGKVLWDVTTNSGVIGPASSFAVNGRQYIAVQSGWGIDARAMQNRLIKMMPGLPEVPEGGAIWVFALRQE
jgi:alcohol dehydrogenase (cytochrome c)